MLTKAGKVKLDETASSKTALIFLPEDYICNKTYKK